MRRFPLILFPTALFAVWALAAPPAPSAGEKPPPKNLLPNGDFEEGDDTPRGWQTVDGLSTFWVKDADPARGRVLKVDTDILQSQGYDWWTKISRGAKAKDAPKKLPTTPPKYDTLAGLDGVWFWSDYISVEPGKAYWLSVDAKGPGGGMLAWLVGYPEKGSTAFGSENGAFLEAKQEREGKRPERGRNFEPFIHTYVWKGQLSSLAQSDATRWKTFTRREKPFRPTENTPSVRFARVMLYAFWPPGEYYFDNVRLTGWEGKEAKK